MLFNILLQFILWIKVWNDAAVIVAATSTTEILE